MTSAITTTILATPDPPGAALRNTFGDYKEQEPQTTTYNLKLEQEGDAKHPKANVSCILPFNVQKADHCLKHLNYLPVWNTEERYPPLQPFTHIEHGIDADKAFPELLGPSVEKEDITPTIGSIISGIQISGLSNAGKDQLALLAGQRKVLVFRDQDFASLPIEKALKVGGYFGRHHIHPTSGAPKGHPEVHIVYRRPEDKAGGIILETRTSTIAWHSDVTYEKQPPGTTFLYILDTPGTGGDTLFVDMVEAYRRLSPEFRKRLHGLKAVHSGIEQAQSAKSRDSYVRREPVTNIHPIVRTHPATGEKALYINPQCEYLIPADRTTGRF